MGNEISVTTELGFIVNEEDFIPHFGKRVPERFHFKDRYDPNTGVKLAAVKVVDAPAAIEWIYNDENVYSFRNLLEKLSEEHNFDWQPIDLGGDTDTCVICVRVPDAERPGDRIEWTRCSIGPGMTLSFILDSKDELERLRKLISSWGVDPGEPEIVNTCRMC